MTTRPEHPVPKTPASLEQACRQLKSELDELAATHGFRRAAEAGLAAAALIKWLRLFGHGNVQISAKDHLVGGQIRAEQYFDIKVFV